jgi:hypothetical protein
MSLSYKSESTDSPSTRIDTLVVFCLVSLSSSSYRLGEQPSIVLPFFRTPDPTQSLCPYSHTSSSGCQGRIFCHLSNTDDSSVLFLLPPPPFQRSFSQRVFFFPMRVRRLKDFGTPTDEPSQPTDRGDRHHPWSMFSVFVTTLDLIELFYESSRFG